MDYNEFYADYGVSMQEAMDSILIFAQKLQIEKSCIEHINSRLKRPTSVIKKLEKQGQAPTIDNAIGQLTDLVGMRLVCRFVNDIYTVAQELEVKYKVLKKKDYISSPKENGYRSYHMIVEVPVTSDRVIPVEIQLRTISQDAWASLEHEMKYKKEVKNEKLIKEELKRCSDEMASIDLCMQTIKEFIEMG